MAGFYPGKIDTSNIFHFLPQLIELIGRRCDLHVPYTSSSAMRARAVRCFWPTKNLHVQDIITGYLRASRDSLRAQVVSKVRTISVYQVISRPSSSVLVLTSMVCQSGSVQPASFLRFFQYQGRLCATLIPAHDARVTDRDVQHLF